MGERHALHAAFLALAACGPTGELAEATAGPDSSGTTGDLPAPTSEPTTTGGDDRHDDRRPDRHRGRDHHEHDRWDDGRIELEHGRAGDRLHGAGDRRPRDPRQAPGASDALAQPCSAIQRSASIAAMHPVPAAVIAWR